MNYSTRILCVALVCSIGISVSAAIKPHFLGRDSAWRVTDIVEVEETDIRGTFAVVNVWKGPLLSGQRVRIPGLAEWQDRKRKIVVRDDPPGPATPLRTARLVLFLTAKYDPSRHTDLLRQSDIRMVYETRYHNRALFTRPFLPVSFASSASRCSS